MKQTQNGGNGGRDPRTGRFAPGNPGGPGNPYARAVAAFRRALYAALAPEDIAALVRSLRDAALAGNVAAARLLLSYLVGSPELSFHPRAIDELEEVDDDWTADAPVRRAFRERLNAQTRDALEGLLV